MEAAYTAQATHKIGNHQEAEHRTLYKKADKAYAKTSEAANEVLYAWKPKEAAATRPPAPKSTLALRIMEDLKPTAMRMATMSLEAYCHWSEQYKNVMKQNAKAFEEHGLSIAKAYLNYLMDSRLATCLKTLLGEDGTLKITETTISDGVS